ncbi:MAG: hypothetical protein E7658_09885 [Ruminococcaceae bacterium]|nr:hypothetical protein [Oscillospiraceae bacterium]
MKKFLAILLAAAMFTAMVSCGTDPIDSTETEATEETADPNVETRTPHNVPTGTTFDGASFTMGFLFGDPEKYFSDEFTGDNMNDAVFRRQKKAEGELDVKLGYMDDVEHDEFVQLYKAGDDVYQYIQLHRISYLEEFSTIGYLRPIEKMPYIDLNADWYNKEQTDAMRMGKYTYFLTSDFNLTDQAAIIFNRNLITDNNFEDPYTLVSNGTWTVDKMVQMAIEVRNDKDGDGLYESEDDVYGIRGGDASLYSPFTTGMGILTGTRNPETGKYEMTMNNETTYEALDKLYRLHENPGSYIYSGVNVNFASGNVLFDLCFASSIERSADISEFVIGILPYPKYDEAQERYYSQATSGLSAIPDSIKNPEMVGAVIEYLSWESGNEVRDTYYNKLLKTRYSNDPETRAMLEIIFDTVTYDPCTNYFGFSDGFSGLFVMPATTIIYGQNNYAANFRVAKGHCKADLARLYTALEALEGPAETETTAE